MAAVTLLLAKKQTFASDITRFSSAVLAEIGGIKLVSKDFPQSPCEIDGVEVGVAGLQAPALVVPTANVVVHGHQAILRTLARLSPEHDLLGETGFNEATCDQWVGFSSEILCQLLVVYHSLINNKPSKDSLNTKMCTAALSNLLSQLNDRLAQATFVSSDRAVTLADVALFGVLFSALTQNDQVQKACGFGSRVHIMRWGNHLAHMRAFALALGAQGLQPWGGAKATTQHSAKPSASSSSTAPCSSQKSAKSSSGIVSINSDHARPESRMTFPFASIADIPPLSAGAVTKQSDGVFRIDSKAVKMPALAQETLAGPTRKQAQQGEPDWDKLGFIHQPLPSPIVIEAPPPNDSEEYGRAEYIRLGQLQLQQQWLERRTRMLEEWLNKNPTTTTTTTTPAPTKKPAKATNASKPTSAATESEAPKKSFVRHPRPADSFKTSDKNSEAIAQTMTSLCHELGVKSGHGIAVPKNWYSMSLEDRRDFLGLESTAQLCKSLVLRNTKCKGNRLEDPTNSEYYIVIVQYVARFNAEKLQKMIRTICGKLGKNHFNFQFVDPEVSEQLTGYGHNAVTPLGMKEPVPVVLSHKIAALPQDYFVMGGGAEDVKVELCVSDYVANAKPFVGDITYDDNEAGGGDE